MPKQNPSANNGGGAPVGKGSVRVIPGRTATGPGLETRGAKITTESQKAAANQIESNYQYRSMDSWAGGKEAGQRGPSAKTIAKAQPVVRAADKKIPIQINSANHQPRIGGHAN